MVIVEDGVLLGPFGSAFHATGEPGADLLKAKSDLAIAIYTTIGRIGITQKEAAARAGEKPARISEIVRGRFNRYSLDRLIRILNALDTDVTIVMQPRDESARRITVVAASGA